jgi:diadenosine tetraphosphate (Ap4A) HIT family hydrolase
MTPADDNSFIIPANLRNDAQRAVYEEIRKAGHCPFCMPQFMDYCAKPVLAEGKFWILTNNRWPYDNVKHQVLAVYKTHIEHLNEMDPQAAAELIELFQAECKKRNIPGGGVAMRFGSTELGDYGSSVLHLHAHLIEPDLTALGADQTFKFKFGQTNEYKAKKKLA